MTRSFHFAPLLGAALFVLAGCQSAGQPGTATPGKPTPEQVAATLAFIDTAGTSGVKEVAFARLAETKTVDPAVRSFAEKMIADLGPVNQQLAALAQSKGAAPPTDIDGPHQVVYQHLQSLRGPAFDRAYVDGELQDLTVTTLAFQSEADTGTDPEVRGFAKQYLPMMLEHVRLSHAIFGG